MLMIGCDPGLTGALALIHSHRGLLACEDIPTMSNGTETGGMKKWVDVVAIDNMLMGWSAKHDFARESVHATVERPIAMPNLPVQTSASSFDTFGAIRTILMLKLNTRFVHLVNPAEWKKSFGLKRDKNESRACCLRLYPTAPVNLAKHHNRAESVLLGHYGIGLIK